MTLSFNLVDFESTGREIDSGAEQALKRAVQLLTQAHERGHADQAVLLDVVKSLDEVLKGAPQHPDAYTLLAYVMLLLDERSAALQYLAQAHQRDPGHLVTLQLMAFAQGQVDESLVQGTPATRIEPNDDDYDQFYFETEDKLRDLSKQIKRILVLPTVIGGAKLDWLESRLSQCYAQAELVYERLELMGDEVDTSELRLQFHHLEKSLDGCKTHLDVSHRIESMSWYGQRMQAYFSQKLGHLRQAPDQAKLKEAEDLLEDLLEQCNAFADYLDSLEPLGLDLSLGLASYQRLIQQTEDLRDDFDELEGLVSEHQA